MLGTASVPGSWGGAGFTGVVALLSFWEQGRTSQRIVGFCSNSGPLATAGGGAFVDASACLLASPAAASDWAGAFCSTALGTASGLAAVAWLPGSLAAASACCGWLVATAVSGCVDGAGCSASALSAWEGAADVGLACWLESACQLCCASVSLLAALDGLPPGVWAASRRVLGKESRGTLAETPWD